MIVFDLACDAGHRFEGWFASSDDFAGQQARGLVTCPECGSAQVTEAPMAPAVSKRAALSETADQARAMREWVTRVRAHVEANSEYVGDKFPDVARAIHYGDAEERTVHGEASLDDARELIEEGIPVAPIPGLPRSDS